MSAGTGAGGPGRRTEALALGLLVAGAAVGFVAFGRTWAEVVPAAVGAGAGSTAYTGGDVYPWAGPVCLTVLACAGGVLALHGWARRAVGVVAVLLAFALLWAAVQAGVLARVDLTAAAADRGVPAPTSVHVTAWWLFALPAAFLVAAGGLLTALLSGGWPAMGARYRRDPGRGASAPTGPRAQWDALDRGEDPTAGPAAGPGLPQ